MESFSKCDPPAYQRLPPDSSPVSTEMMPPVMPVHVQQATAPPMSQGHDITFNAVPAMQGTVNFGPKPQIANCPYCHVQTKTKVRSKALTKAHCWAVIFFCIGFWPCICCPYCCCDCSKKFHHCGNCNTFLGTYRP